MVTARGRSTDHAGDTPNVCARAPLGAEDDFGAAVLSCLDVVRKVVLRPSCWQARDERQRQCGKNNYLPFPRSAILTVMRSIVSGTVVVEAERESMDMLSEGGASGCHWGTGTGSGGRAWGFVGAC
jgi:hypothetical protein